MVRRSRTLASTVGTAALLSALALAGCGSTSDTPTLTWYTNPDNGGQAALAKKCTEASGGRYRIETALLPRVSTGQREQLVRRLAAEDSGIDLMSLDIPYLAEFANAGFIRKFGAAESAELTEGMLAGPLKSAQWEDAFYGIPFNANTQLLWVRQHVAEEAGLDLTQQLTWDQVIEAAEETGTTVQVQAARYEGYTVLINSLVASAGGEILKNPEAGKDVEPAIDSPAGKAAARVLRTLGNSPAAAADLENSDEGTTQAGFLADNGGFMTNWPFVYAAAQGTPVLQDFAWSRWPAVEAGQPSRPPLGGINLAIGAYTEFPDLAVDAVRCITSPESQKQYMLAEGLLSTYESAYDDPEVTETFPMASLLRESLKAAAPRPITPYYPDVTAVIQRTWHPPAAVGPETPQRTADLIVAVLRDEELI